MRIVQEMYARGFDFLPMDIYKARARHFQVMGNKLMPSINSIDGLGEKAADSHRGGGQGRSLPLQGGFQEPDQGQQDHLRPDGRTGDP